MRRYRPDIAIIALLFLLPLVMFWPQTVGGRTMLPTENLYQYEPYATYREVVKAPEAPHNALLSDLVLENMQWKIFIRESIARGEIPLWNPYQFSGIPFLAAGQQSALYPFSLIYYVMPLTAAYGWFTVVQLWLAGAFMYSFLRAGLGKGRLGALIAGITYQLAGFMVISAVFPMIIAAAAWLPLLLWMIEWIVQQRPLWGRPASVPWAVIGAVALGCNILAGHVEITYYTLLIMGYYAAARLVVVWWQPPPPAGKEEERRSIAQILQRGAWLISMVAMGVALGAVQFIPLFEFASMNFRSGSASYEQVVGWAHPLRDVVQFALPNFYGNPSHHSYFDVFTREVVPVTVNAFGQPIQHTDWGIKNYAEGALYVGILPLALAGYGIIQTWLGRRGDPVSSPVGMAHRPSPTGAITIFTLLALLGLTLMFGLPTYRLLYALPGIDQLHSPFRWIYAVTLSVAALAGLGADKLTHPVIGAWRPLRKWFGVALLALGVLVLIALLLSYVFYDQVEPLAQWILDNMVTASGEPASARFADARMFYSYQFTNVLTLGVMLLGAGAVFLWANPSPQPPPRRQGGGVFRAFWCQVFSVALVAVDLMIASWGFFPASDPALLDFTPPAIQWLQAQEGDWRYTTLDDSTQRPIMNANMGWRHHLRDIRGYESIIPKHYVEYMQQIAPQTQLEFNRIAPLYTDYGTGFDYTDALQSPMLDLLGVRYVITHKSTTLPEALTTPRDLRTGPEWTLAYQDDAVRIWSNGNNSLLRALPHLDSPLHSTWPPDLQADTGREKIIDVRMDEPTWLVVSETYMPGWRAFIRPWGASDKAEVALDVERVYGALQGVHVQDINALVNAAIENGTAPQTFYLNAIEAAIEANDAARVETLIDQLEALVATNPPEIFGNINARIAEAIAAWRASDNTSLEQRAFESKLLELKQANWTVRLVYGPASFQIGAFVSFLGVVLVVFMPGVWLWRLYVGGEQGSTIGRVVRNSLAPIILNLFNRGIDFAFALVMLRILGPEDAGIYFYAGFVFVWFDIFTNFGLDLYLTREVARDRSRAAGYFFSTSALRFGLTLIGIVLLLAFLWARQTLIVPPLSADGVIAILLLYVGLFPGSLSKGMTSLFYAFEQAEYPAAITTISTLSKTLLGLVALVLGYGVIGLAGVSIITNVLTLAVLLWGGRRLFTSPPNPLSTHGEGEHDRAIHTLKGINESPLLNMIDNGLDFALMRRMMGESWPLLLNHFLATIFFQIDVLIIEALHGARMVGLYSVAYKWLSALNVIPAFFTQAMLPVMSRQAQEDRDALRRTYVLSVKLLLILALPVAVLFTFTAYFLTAVLGGVEYLPDSAIATQIMIWSIPFGWINSLTQYVLVALDLQRRITRAFAIAVTFNIVTNLIFVPQYGYQAAALATIASEFMLLLPFSRLLNGPLGNIPWLEIIWRPAAASAVMGVVLALGWNIQPVLTLLVALVIYPAVLLTLRPLTNAELERLRPLLPGRLRRMFAISS
jgi:O-antigen/teichoic acid export membrane protein